MKTKIAQFKEHSQNAVLQAEKITLGYDEANIIESVSLDIPKGKITALIGPNGCGKSTLLRGLSRLLKARAGVVYLNGTDISKIPTKKIAQQMGVLPQGPSTPEGLTVKELVAQGRYPHQNFFQQWSKEDEDAVAHALEITKMQEFSNRPITALSGGQRQRVWIAMTLAQETDIFLLDEPTTFLDLAHQIEVMDLLVDLNHAYNTTIVAVLHDLNQAARYADNIVAMKKGAIYHQGKTDEVITSELIKDVFGLENQIIQDPISQTPLCIPIGKHDHANLVKM